MELVVGSHNAKKAAELVELLEPHGFRVVTLADVGADFEVDETGKTFAENAALKAVQYAKHLNKWVLADDSGIAVDALGGAPGVYSARFAGTDADDEANNKKLLADLKDEPPDKRTAHYVCHVVVADPSGEIRAETSAICRGRIRLEPVGENGFGYDPLFEVVEYHQTFGELDPCVKRVLSHRSRALRQIVPDLVALKS